MTTTFSRGAVLLLAVAAAGSAAHGQCQPAFDGTHASAEIDAGREIRSLFVWEQGFPGSLLAGGSFELIGGMPAGYVALWDGRQWHPLGEGMSYAYPSAGSVSAFAAYDWAGSGAALFAGGLFSEADGEPASNLARWDGSRWIAVPTGADGGIRALRVFDHDGGGPERARLYVGGEFRMLDGLVADGLAMWDGEAWESIGQGGDGDVYSLVVFDPDGHGPQPESLYAAGVFTTIGGVYSPGLARFDGQTWHALPNAAFQGFALDAIVFDPDGDGPGNGMIVVAGQDFLGRPSLGAWDGDVWRGRVTGEEGEIRKLAAWGADVYATGPFAMGPGNAGADLIRWTPDAGWSILQEDVTVSQHAAIRGWDRDGDGGEPSALMIGGDVTVEGVGLPSLVRWDGEAFRREGRGVLGVATPFALTGALGPFERGLYLGGPLTMLDDMDTDGAARWDGEDWSSVVWPFDGRASIASWDPDGDGPLAPEAIAGGRFSLAAGQPVKNIARWTGIQWEQLGEDLDGTNAGAVGAVVAWDEDGGGPGEPLLCIGGWFGTCGGREIGRVARWDGSDWQRLGDGLGVAWLDDDSVESMAAADVSGGGAPLLYAAGSLTISRTGDDASVAVLENGQWRSLAAREGTVRQLLTLERAGRAALYAHGEFSTIGGVPAVDLAGWTGSGWEEVGAAEHGRIWGASVVEGEVLGASGRVIVAHGEFQGGDVAYWDGEHWHAMFESRGGFASEGWRAVSFDEDGSGPLPAAIHLTGGFDWMGGASARGYERYGCPPPECFADYNGDGEVNTIDFIAYLNDFVRRDPEADCDGDGITDTRDFVCFLNAWTSGC